MNKLLTIRVFVTVVNQNGFTAAGEYLNMSVSSVTKMVARLEQDLGTRLLNRSPRNVTMTEIGREYYDRCVKLIADLDEADEVVRDSSGAPRGKLRVLVPNSFGRVTLAPRLPEFFARYPEMSIELSFGDDMHGLLTQKHDVVVGTAELESSRLVTRVLLNVKKVTVASPEYLKVHGVPQTPADLSQHNCIIGPNGPLWPYIENGQEVTKRVSGPLTVLNGDVMREAAVCHLGVAQGTWFLFRKDLERGDLVSILEDYSVDSEPVRVVFHDNKHFNRKIRVFIDFLVEITRQT